MRAAVHTRFGSPDVVSVQDLPTPEPGDDEILVRVHVTTVNRTDCAYRAGKPLVARPAYGLTRPRVRVLGCEFAGEVARTGSRVSAYRAGDRVFGYNDARFGGHAEYAVVPPGGLLATIPEGLGFDQVAPALEGSHYALAAINASWMPAGAEVLINGATGAIGSAAVQLCRQRGLRVTAVCGPAHVDLVSRLGASRVIDHTERDFTAGDDRFDVVIDAVGKSTFGRARRILKPGGSYLSTELGPWGQNPLLALVTPMLGGRRVRFPIPRNDPRLAALVRDLMASGEYRPVVDRTYPIDDIVKAYRYVETGQKVGSVLVQVVA